MVREDYIKRTLQLAARAKGLTSPNPLVGAILVKQGKIISEDYHKGPGKPHAEALVIEKAKKDTEGATLYVNLEPCCHIDKRTPPCTKAIIKAGIKEVIIGMSDPNPKVSGRGIIELKKAGIKVVHGILEDKSRKLNEFYVKYITSGLPFVILKIAMTLDGKIATPEGQSKWITGEKARKRVHILRSHVDALLTAIGTVKADDPKMTCRIGGRRSPLRIVIDPNLEIPVDAKILQNPPETVIVTKKASINVQNNKIDLLTKKGVKLIEYAGEKVDLYWLISQLGKRGINSILIEGGASLNAYALQSGIVDKVMFFIAPKIIGGIRSYPSVGGEIFKRLEDAYRIKDIKINRIGEDILIEGYIIK